MIDDLTRYAIRYGTDKFGYHDYTPRYHALLSHLRNKPLRMLEIGVGGYGDPRAGGASLQAWRDYFPQAQIVGIDIALKEHDLGPRIVVERGSQIDPAFLSDLVDRHGPFDIILDDGSHQNGHVISSFELLFGTLRPDGFYIVEDVQTAFFPRFGGSIEMTSPNSVRFFADVMDQLVTDDPGAADIAQMWRFHNIVALQKRGEQSAPISEASATLSAEKTEEAALTEAVAPLASGDMLRVAPLSNLSEGLRRRFVEIDHREMVVFHPDVRCGDVSRHIDEIRARRGEVFLRKGPNDFPSNFAFDASHPEAKSTLAHIRTVLEEAPTEAGLLSFGVLAKRSGLHEDMRFAAATLEANETEDPACLAFVVQAARELSDAAHERRALERAFALHPHEPSFVSWMAGALMSDGDLARAEKVLLGARAAGLNSADIAVRLSNLYARDRRFEDALAEGKAAVGLDPRWPQAWRALIRAYRVLNQNADAETACKSAIDRCPANPALLMDLTEILLKRQETAGAQDALERARTLAPDLPRVAQLQARIDAV